MDKIELVAEIISNVRDSSKKTEKEEILRQNKDNELLRDILNHIFNPYIKTNIAKKKLTKKVEQSDSTMIKSVYEYMDYLSKSSGRDEQIAQVQSFISYYPKGLQWLLESMATKSLKIGATATTINKAFEENFIPKFEVMLAEKYIETKKIKGVPKIYEHWKRYEGKQIIATKKLDGNRCAVFVRDDGLVQLYSREGHLLDGYVELEDAFSKLPKGHIYDGEILATNEDSLNSKELFKKTSKIVKKKGVKKGVEFYAFDIIPITEFKKGGWEVSCRKRKDALKKVISNASHHLIHYVEPLYSGEFDYDVIDDLIEKAKINGEEGVMCQLADAPYECKRTYSILKCKVFESADVRCVDVYEGKSGKNIGRLGGLIVDYKGYKVNIGGGFSDQQRIDYWKDPALIIGRIVEITYFEEFEDEEGEIDLRFGQFKTVRDDKDEPSYY